MGNLGSIKNMLKKIGFKSKISSEIKDIKNADKLILPGVGAFDLAIKNLTNLGIIPFLDKQVFENKTPVLGICLGMQLLSKRSEEGELEGLSWLDTHVKKFVRKKDRSLKIPHMGWNTVSIKRESCLFKDLYKEPRFYFVHSYYVECKDSENILTTTEYGKEFCSSVMKNNIYGVQFHPEKSHKFGMKLLKNFMELC